MQLFSSKEKKKINPPILDRIWLYGQNQGLQNILADIGRIIVRHMQKLCTGIKSEAELELMAEASHLEFIRWLKGLESREYLLSVIAYGAAPTILGIKPATLLNFHHGPRDLQKAWNVHKGEILRILELESFELKKEPGSVSILFFCESKLEELMTDKEIRAFLNSLGYAGCKTVSDCLYKLKERFRDGCPHEIGLFLGFPVEDVKGFIQNCGRNSILCRYWKVYHNRERANELFSQYDAARNAVINWVREFIPHSPIEEAGTF